MTFEVASDCLEERLAKEIASRRVVAALFSTFTFSRDYFERVPLPLVTADGRLLDRIPISVILDPKQYCGHGIGYDPVRGPSARLWHPKFIVVMTESFGENETILAIGSGNLTRNGWEMNQELFHVERFATWSLPQPLMSLLKEPWVKESRFAAWARDAKVSLALGSRRSILGSWEKPLWGQLHFVSRKKKWTTAHVVTPFSDAAGDDDDDAKMCGPFFNNLVSVAASKHSRLTVYLRAADPSAKTAFGDPEVFRRLSKKVRLRIEAVIPESGRPLHAKLVALRSGGKWSAVLGSPNATGPAFTKRDGNMELCCELTKLGTSVPKGLLPRGKEVKISKIQLPLRAKVKPRWECLESAAYDGKKQELILTWKGGHSPKDSRVLHAGRELRGCKLSLTTGSQQFLETAPRGPAIGNFDHGFVPIEVSDQVELPAGSDESDMSAADWLACLAGAPLPADVTPGRAGGSRPGQRRTSGKKAKASPFPWRKRVHVLIGALQSFLAECEALKSMQDARYQRRIVSGVWKAHDPTEGGLTVEEAAWRDWVRASLLCAIWRLDGRLMVAQPLLEFAKAKKGLVPKVLRGFDFV